MKGKNLLILVVLAAGLVFAAIKTSTKNAPSTSSAIGKKIFPNLILDDIDNITVISKEGTAAVSRPDMTWLAPDRYNYPADFNKVKDIAMKFTDLKIGQVMKLDDKQKAAMQLVSPVGASSNSAGRTGILVELRSKGSRTLASLLIGEARMKKPGSDMPDYGGYPDGQYVSPDNGKNVYLVNTTLAEIPLNTKNWLDAELLSVQGSDISDISITGPDRKDIKLARKKDGSVFEVEGLATNEVTAESKMYSLESALSYFKLDDVADPSTAADQAGLDKPAVFRATTKKGEIYTVRIGKKKGDTENRYCKIEVVLKDAEKKPEAKDDAGKKQADAEAKERKEQENRIKTLNDKLSKWTYLIAAQKLDALLPARETLIEAKKEEKKPEESKAEEKKSDEIKTVSGASTPAFSVVKTNDSTAVVSTNTPKDSAVDSPIVK